MALARSFLELLRRTCGPESRCSAQAACRIYLVPWQCWPVDVRGSEDSTASQEPWASGRRDAEAVSAGPRTEVISAPRPRGRLSALGRELLTLELASEGPAGQGHSKSVFFVSPKYSFSVSMQSMGPRNVHLVQCVAVTVV